MNTLGVATKVVGWMLFGKNSKKTKQKAVKLLKKLTEEVEPEITFTKNSATLKFKRRF